MPAFSEFNRNVLTLVKGTVGAQAIQIAVSPILTRLYTPQDFGLLAVYIALGAVLLIVATARLEVAIMLPKSDLDARALLNIVVLTSLAVATLTLAAAITLGDEIARLLNNPGIAPWLLLLPLSVVATGLYNGLYFYSNRNAQYPVMSASKVWQSTTAAGLNVACGIAAVGKGGLVFGTLAGQIAAAVFLYIRSAPSRLLRAAPLATLRRALVAYRKFPLVQLPSTLIETVSAQAPVVLLSTFFGPAVIGLYSLADRVARIPITMLGAGVGDVFRQRASLALAERGNAGDIFSRTLAKLLLVSALPFAVFYFAAPMLFSFVFGSEWRAAGEYAQILTPMYWLSFVVAPLSNMLAIAQKQEYDLMLQIGLVCASVAALGVGYYYFDSVEYSLALFAAVYCVKYGIELLLSYRLANLQRVAA